MESMIMFLVGFPFISALLLSVFKNTNARKIITYVSSSAIIIVAVLFAYNFFANGDIIVSEEKEIFGIEIVEIFDYLIIAVETFLVIVITALSVKYKKYYATVLSILQTGATFIYEFCYEKKPEVSNNMTIDQLTVIMVLIIAIVGTLITVYACGYMKDYHHHHTELKNRSSFFFAIMYVFIGAMFGLVLSNNLLWLYFFWEITSVSSFLLIGYTKTDEAITNCFRALWMNLLGGCAIAAAIIYAGVKYGVGDIKTLISMDGSAVVIVVLLLGFAALTKSAQLPFSRWLLGAMVAPTPSSALLHSATMVKAGVYLLIRLAPVMSGQLSGYMVGAIGAFTFLMMSFLAISATDGKKVLAYSTLSNLGLITACAGVGTAAAVWSAVFLVIFHAVSKALLFQTVGSIEHQTGSREVESMHGLFRRYPNLAWTLVVGIAGMYLAPFGMLISKWAALKSFIDDSSVMLTLFVCFGSATTLVYWSKWLATVLASNPQDKRQKNTITANQWVSLIVHAVLMILICFAFPVISNKVVTPYVQSIYFASSSSLFDQNNLVTMVVMIALVFVMPLIIWFMSVKNNPFDKSTRYLNGISDEEQTGFVDSFGNNKKITLANWYMDGLFGEERLFKPSVITATIAIVTMFIVVLIQTVI